VRCFSVDLVVAPPSRRDRARTNLGNSEYQSAVLSAGPAMISGVRASSDQDLVDLVDIRMIAALHARLEAQPCCPGGSEANSLFVP